MKNWIASLLVASIACASFAAAAPQSPPEQDTSVTKEQAAQALHKAVAFFRSEISVQGGYLWRYSADLSLREGEGKAGAQTAWVQPPGTPSVGEAILDAYEATHEASYLDAARETAMALVNGQLVSGGWDYRIEFDPRQRVHYAYRQGPPNEKGANTSTLDDDTTQSALRYLIRIDRALKQEDPAIHEAAVYALEHLLTAQRPSGGWPQRFTKACDPAEYPVKSASYPEAWPREWPHEDYKGYYTFNDEAIQTTIETMLDARHAYGDERFRASAEKAGDFILMAQMPDPQPGWAQQYNAQMQPAWARKFEPPAITGCEAQRVMETLIALYKETANARYLEPIPRALKYYRASLLPEGQLARFYELQTNKPLYFTKDYVLTYSDVDMPTHYSFKVGSSLDAIQAEYEAVKALAPEALKKEVSAEKRVKMSERLAKEAQAIVRALDDRGAWVEDGALRAQDRQVDVKRIIDCATFAENVKMLCRFLVAE